MLPVDELGAGEPVVLLHAGVADRTMWRDHLGRLADAGYRGIAPDLPGFGEAALTPGPQAPWEDVLTTVRELGVGPVHLVGNSFGAAVALRVAVVAPAAVRSLVAVSPPPLNAEPSPALEAAWDAEEEALGAGDLDAAVEAVLNAWLLPGSPPELRERVARMQRRAFELQQGVTDADEAPDPLERDPRLLSALQIPVLALAGEGDMPDFKLAVEQIAEEVPHARARILSHAGHLAPLETPDEFWGELRQHLERTEATAA